MRIDFSERLFFRLNMKLLVLIRFVSPVRVLQHKPILALAHLLCFVCIFSSFFEHEDKIKDPREANFISVMHKPQP